MPQQTTVYLAVMEAQRDFRKGCDKGSNPYLKGSAAADNYDLEMDNLFEKQWMDDLKLSHLTP